MASELAVLGGEPVRAGKSWPAWPVHGEAEVRLVQRVLASGRWSSEGPMETEFTRRFSDLHGARHGFCVTSGTAALEVALRAAGVRAGDEVIVPALTWVATAAAVLAIGATAVFVDIDPDTYQIAPGRVESAVTPRTRVIIPVHLYNRVADLDPIIELARSRGIRVVEDCAHAHGGTYKGQAVGSIGDLGCFSFQATKTISSGEGGFVTTNDDTLAERIFGLKNCGRGWRGGPSGKVVGRNVRITEFQAAVLLAQLDRFGEQADRRAQNGAYLDRRLAEVPGIRPLSATGGDAGRICYGYVFRYDEAAFSGIGPDVFRSALRAEGIPAGPTYGPVYASPLWGPGAHERWVRRSGSVAELVNAEAVVLNHPLLLGSRDDMDDIVAAVRKVQASALALVGRAEVAELPAGVE